MFFLRLLFTILLTATLATPAFAVEPCCCESNGESACCCCSSGEVSESGGAGCCCGEASEEETRQRIGNDSSEPGKSCGPSAIGPSSTALQTVCGCSSGGTATVLLANQLRRSPAHLIVVEEPQFNEDSIGLHPARVRAAVGDSVGWRLSHIHLGVLQV